MQSGPLVVRRHAIFKRQYRRVVAATPDFHNLTPEAQWTLLRAQVIAEAATGDGSLLQVLDSRAPRRDEVLTKLEAGRRDDSATDRRQR